MDPLTPAFTRRREVFVVRLALPRLRQQIMALKHRFPIWALPVRIDVECPRGGMNAAGVCCRAALPCLGSHLPYWERYATVA